MPLPASGDGGRENSLTGTDKLSATSSPAPTTAPASILPSRLTIPIARPFSELGESMQCSLLPLKRLANLTQPVFVDQFNAFTFHVPGATVPEFNCRHYVIFDRDSSDAKAFAQQERKISTLQSEFLALKKRLTFAGQNAPAERLYDPPHFENFIKTAARQKLFASFSILSRPLSGAARSRNFLAKAAFTDSSNIMRGGVSDQSGDSLPGKLEKFSRRGKEGTFRILDVLLLNQLPLKHLSAFVGLIPLLKQ